MIDQIKVDIPRPLSNLSLTCSKAICFLENDFIMKKLWVFENKNIEFHVNKLKDYRVIIKTKGGEVLISKEEIYGVPAKALEDPILDLYLRNTYVKVGYGPSGKALSVSIYQRGEGGIEPATAFLIGCAILGVCGIIAGAIQAYSQHDTNQTNLEIARINQATETTRQNAAIRIAEIEQETALEVAAANRFAAQQRRGGGNGGGSTSNIAGVGGSSNVNQTPAAQTSSTITQRR